MFNALTIFPDVFSPFHPRRIMWEEIWQEFVDPNEIVTIKYL
jgi:hypothetical protein